MRSKSRPPSGVRSAPPAKIATRADVHVDARGLDLEERGVERGEAVVVRVRHRRPFLPPAVARSCAVARPVPARRGRSREQAAVRGLAERPARGRRVPRPSPRGAAPRPRSPRRGAGRGSQGTAPLPGERRPPGDAAPSPAETPRDGRTSGRAIRRALARAGRLPAADRRRFARPATACSGPTLRDGAVVLDDVRVGRRRSRSAGATSRRRGATGSTADGRRRAVRRRARPRRPEGADSSRRASRCSRSRWTRRRASAPRRSCPTPSASRSSACAPATSPALAVQDRIFLRDRFPDPRYAARRAAPVPGRGRLHALRRRPASARRWTPARSRARATTSR